MSYPQLTPEGLYSLLQEAKTGILLQIISSETTLDPDNKPKRYKVVLSDGSCKHPAVLINEAARVFNNTGAKLFSIIFVKDTMQQQTSNQKRLVVITKMEMKNTQIVETIGDPIDFQEWLTKIDSKNRSASQQRNIAASKNEDFNPLNSSIKVLDNKNNESFDKSFESIGEINNTPKFVSSLMNFNNPGMAQKSNNQTSSNYQKSSTDINPTRYKDLNRNVENTPTTNPKPIKKGGSVRFINPNKYSGLEDEFQPVESLAPYSPFIIKVRVTSKSDMRTFRQGMGEGKLFTAEVIDKDGSEITCTFFGEAAEKFYPILKENGVYIMRDGNVRMQNSKYNKKNNNEYQIVYDKKDVFIQPVQDDTDIMLSKFNYTKISKISELDVNSVVDIATFVKEIGDCIEIPLKKNNELKERRSLILYDDSKVMIEMTLWGESAKNIDFNKEDLIIIKSAKVNNFGGTKNLTSSFGTRIFSKLEQLSEDPFLNQLKEWKEKEYCDEELQPFSIETTSRKSTLYTIEEINNTLPIIREKANFDLIASISHIKSEGNNLYYPACKNKDKCARKATFIGEDMFECPYCKESFRNPIYRYSLQVKISDHTGSLWIHAFDRAGATIMEKDADSLKQLKDMQDENGFSEIFKQALYKEFNFRLYAKKDDYNGEGKFKLQATRVENINYVKQGREVLSLLEQFISK